MGSRLSHLPGRARFFSHPGPDEIPCTQRRHAHDLQYMPDGGFVLFHFALSGDSRLDQVGTAVKRQQAPRLIEHTPRDLECGMVRKGGLEPPWSCDRQPLKLVRLPISPLPLSKTVKSAMNCRFLRNQSELLNLPLKWVGWRRAGVGAFCGVAGAERCGEF